MMMVGRDFNSHHVIWRVRRGESSGISKGADCLVLNRGNTPTFQNRLRIEVIGVTLRSALQVLTRYL